MTRADPLTVTELAKELALDELLCDRDVRPRGRPGLIRCDVDRTRRLRALGRPT